MAGVSKLTKTNDQEKFLSTREAAEYLGLCEQTLRHKRITADGPEYVKLGNRVGARVVYRLSALKKWLEGRTFNSTSEETVARQARG